MGQLSFEPLRHLFGELVEKNYSVVGIHNEGVTEYVACLLENFSSIRTLYRIRSASGRPLQTLGELLIESNPVYGEADSFEREREVRKHIGDFALFFTGMFPESLGRIRRRSQFGDGFVDYVTAGKESYHIVSEYDRMRPAHANSSETSSDSGPLFDILSEEFERCMYGLNLVKSELESFQDPMYQEVKRILM